jgi:hypothetical protein
MVHNIDTTVLVLDVPLVVSKSHIDDVSRLFSSLLILCNKDLSHWNNCIVDTFLSFCLIDLSDSPPLNPSISTCRKEIVSVLDDYLNLSVVKWFVWFNLKHEM